MITIDDLRPQLNSYGVSETRTPNIDELAKGATVFQHAYCQMAVCSPSRNSFMSGRRPDTTKVWNFINHFRQPEVGANWTSLPQYFKEHGYYSYGAGKLYHPNRPPANDYPTSWTEDLPHNPSPEVNHVSCCSNDLMDRQWFTRCLKQLSRREHMTV